MKPRHSRSIFDKIFNAQSVALIGASAKPGKLGYIIIETLINGGYAGDIYPVNPRGGEVLGLPMFKGISDVPVVVDTMLVAIPSVFVPNVLLEAAKKGVQTAVILSAGFRESGRPDLEDEIIQIANEYDFHFLGPNIQGVYSPPNQMSAAFFPSLKKAGPVAVISQSGSVTAYLVEQLELENIGSSAGVNLGNKTNVDENDLLEYFREDENTRAIALYLEGISDGRRFLNTIKQTLPKKPVVIMKSGRTESGIRSAASHTGAMAANDAVFDAACRQRGLFRAITMEALVDAAKGAALSRMPKGNRLMVISSSGGGNTLAADAADEYGLVIPSLPEQFVERAKKELVLPFNASVSNPCDLAFFEGSLFRDIVKLADEFDIADTYLLNYGDPIENGVEAALELANSIQASLAVAYFGGGEKERQSRLALHEHGLPVYATPERAITGIAASVQYAEYCRSIGGTIG
jgi:acyl-CoA synthetase (NDP forming)